MPSAGERRAVVDVGSNSVLLTVGEFRGEGWVSIHETSKVTGLGENTKSTGLLSNDAMDRTLAALVDAFAEAQRFGAPTRAYATMAARIATNTPSFLAHAANQRTPVAVIPGEVEAELGARSVLHDPLFINASRITVIDIGGHSTEVVTSVRTSDWADVFNRSLPIGTLSVKSTFLTAESPSRQDLLRASAAIDDAIGLGYVRDAVGEAVALGASATNLIAIRDQIEPWEPARVHGASIDYEEVSRFVGSLSRLTERERAKLKGIEPGREGTIHIGALILERVLHAVHSLGCRVSVRGWRHAMLDVWR